MKLNLPPQVRAAIYVAVVIGTALVVPLHASGVLNDVVMAVWSSVAGAASGLAALNVTPEDK